MSKLKELRIEKKLTQQEVADLIGISLRSYKSYENYDEKQGTIKYQYIKEQLEKINFVDEEHGIQNIIKDLEFIVAHLLQWKSDIG